MRADTFSASPIEGLRDIYTDLPTFGNFLVADAKLLIAVAVVWVTWWAINRLTTAFGDHEEIVENRNTAFLIVRFGMTVGSGLALVPLVGALSDNTASDFTWLAVGGAVIALFFALLIQPALDTMLFRKPRSFNLLRELSVAHAIVIGSFYVADGLIVIGAMSGSAPSIGVAIGATIGFALLGFATLAVTYLVVGKLFGMRRAVKYGDNIAAAVILGTIVVSLGLILKKSVTGDWTGLASGLVGFLVYAVIGIVVLIVLIPILDKLFLGMTSVREVIRADNYHAAIAMAAVTGVIALLLSSVNVT